MSCIPRTVSHRLWHGDEKVQILMSLGPGDGRVVQGREEVLARTPLVQGEPMGQVVRQVPVELEIVLEKQNQLGSLIDRPTEQRERALALPILRSRRPAAIDFDAHRCGPSRGFQAGQRS
jgi:hypothetical protein